MLKRPVNLSPMTERSSHRSPLKGDPAKSQYCSPFYPSDANVVGFATPCSSERSLDLIREAYFKAQHSFTGRATVTIESFGSDLLPQSHHMRVAK